MSTRVQQVLEQMGLSEGYHIPIANEENVKLEAELQRLLLAKARAASTLESINTKRIGLEKHLKYVKAEQLENQNILFARNSQLKDENHMYKLLKMEYEREAHDIKKMKDEQIKIEENKQHKLITLKSMMSKMEKLKQSVKWDEKSIKSLEELLKKKDEDNELIKKFSKEDRRKADDLEVKRKRLKEEELSRRQLVVRIANEIENMELTIGRNGQMYKMICEDRNRLVHQWQDSVKQLQQRHKDTINLTNEIVLIKESIATNTLVLEEQRQFAENERTNNFELEDKIRNDNAVLAKTKNLCSNFSLQVKDYNIELASIQRELRLVATSLEAERANKKLTESQLSTLRNNYDLALNTALSVKERLKLVETSNLTAEERLRQLEQILENEEKNGEILINDIERIQGVIFRSQSTLADLTEAFKIKELRQRIDENAIVTLTRQKTQNELESRTISETLYKLNFRSNMLENRIGRMSGERHDDFSEMHQIRLKELKVTLQKVNEASNLLQAQITKLEEDMRRLSITITSNTNLLDTMRARLNDRMLMVDGATKLVKQQQSDNNSKKVELNVLSVRLQGAQNALHKEGGYLYDLQRQKMELDGVVQKRQTEIAIQKELLISKKRALLEDIGRMRGDMQLRKIKTEQLKKRLDCVLESLGRSETGEALSVTYFRVKNAQEKYAVQQEGDRLDREIKKLEQEIVALENTLRVVNNTNQAYKRSLDVIDENGEELEQLKRLEEKYKEVGIILRARTKFFSERSLIIRTLRTCIDDIRNKYNEVNLEFEERQQKLNVICNEENERKNKINRAIAANTRKGSCACNNAFMDMATRQYKEVLSSILQQLYEISVRHFETEPIIIRYLAENDLPSMDMCRCTSKVNLRRTSRSSSRKSSSSVRVSESTGSSVPSVLYTLNIP